MTLKNSVLSLFGNAVALAKNGLTKEMRSKWQKKVDEMKVVYPTVEREYRGYERRLRESMRNQQGRNKET